MTMWGRTHRIWKQHTQQVLAVEEIDAQFLVAFLVYIKQQRLDCDVAEILDLQRYKRICKPKKVKVMMKERCDEPFVFISCRN